MMFSDIERKIKELEEELKRTEYNKATEHHIGKLKAKIARLREELEKRRRKAKGGPGYDIKKSGDASVAIVGPPGVGKSTLMNALIGKSVSQVGNYLFTTNKVVPGMMEHSGINVQLLDLPGLLEGASEGRGNGRKVLSVVRSADLALIVLDVYTYEFTEVILREMYKAGIRINKRRPNIKVTKTGTGGIQIHASNDVGLSMETIKEALIELGYHSAEITINERSITIEDIIDAALGNRAYIPAIFVLNKVDLVIDDINYLRNISYYFRSLGIKKEDSVAVSALKGWNIDVLKEKIISKLNLVRVYLKPPNGSPDYSSPLVLKSPARVADVCEKLGENFIEDFKYACVWGRSVKYPGQRVGLEHVLSDGDVITIYLKKRA